LSMWQWLRLEEEPCNAQWYNAAQYSNYIVLHIIIYVFSLQKTVVWAKHQASFVGSHHKPSQS
jgi:hypothetical protein